MNRYIKDTILSLLNQIPPGQKRALFVVIALVLLGVVSFLYDNSLGIVGLTFIWLLILRFIYLLGKHLVMLYPRVSRRFIRKSWRLVVSIRRFYKVSEEAEFLHTLTLLILLVAFEYFIITKNIYAFTLSNSVILILLGSAAIFDLYFRISWLMKKAWAKVLGKIALAGLGTVLVFVASAIAKQNVSELTQADSQNFADFVGLLTALYTPLLFGMALACIVLSVAFIEFLCTFVLGSIAMYLTLIAPGLSKKLGAKFISRILGKKKSSANDGHQEWREMIYLLRPIALIIASYAITSSVIIISTHFSKNIEWTQKNVLVLMHYRFNYECNNLDKKALVVKLGDNMVSVANVSSDIIFTTQKCER